MSNNIRLVSGASALFALLCGASITLAQPQGGFPGGPGPFPFPRPGEILPGFLQDQLKLTAEQKKKLGELQKDVEAKLAELLTAEQKKSLAAMTLGGGKRGDMMPPGGVPGGALPNFDFGGLPRFGGFNPGRANDVQKKIAATDEEWQVIGPKVQKVNSYRRVLSGENAGGPLFTTALAQAQAELKTVLDDAKHTRGEVDEKIAAVRKARERANADLQEAQRDLTRLLTQTQQAVLVSLGYLE